ncbi:RES family NAD+ phosphorylase [Neptunomonas antarctica]|uniref:RES domain-containing protein n=1 Tax=Neptunomonas antarctica TaxID=619304 RepID=A0A1N7LLM8_9GAMM|nr:RES family NAD+ phosphorylase [Neptunomonas antarctica]SIS74743.1 RES domain-containing protein [Neptunomonas antarctica]
MLWQKCNGQNEIKPITGTLCRMVESQEQVATLGYVDTLAEQSVLEELLEGSKPAYPEETTSLHYLLKTPFRYPPLLWGSRFGRMTEPSLFYGGKSLEATLIEAAYYRLVFLFSMQGTPPKPRLNSEHTLFSVSYSSPKGIRLQNPPFDNYLSQLTHLSDYSACQQLGSSMREAGVEVFEYLSARAQNNEICVALFSPAAFSDKAPTGMDQWLCESSADFVVFKTASHKSPYFFPVELFLVAGTFPMPA